MSNDTPISWSNQNVTDSLAKQDDIGKLREDLQRWYRIVTKTVEIKVPFKNTRMKRWKFAMYFIGSWVLVIWLSVTLGEISHEIGIVLATLLTVLSIFLIKRRMNDIGYSGWWILIFLAQILALFMLIFEEGTKWPNKFWDEPE